MTALAVSSRELLHRMEAAAEHLSLPWRSRQWRGQAGSLLGPGTGSSIDFQDHRPYLPGDDPRYIDWRAYARTGHYIMKMYREEVSPLLDLALDVSASMAVTPEKARRSLELTAFCVASARRTGASIRCFTVTAREVRPFELEPLLAGETDLFGSAAPGAPALERVPWRAGSMRLVLSDLLFPGAPDVFLAPLAASRGRGLLLAPYGRFEAEPDWQGNLEMEDCETRQRRVQSITPALRARYTAGYARHFTLWQERARRHQALLARVPVEGDFVDALRGEALPLGAVELC